MGLTEYCRACGFAMSPLDDACRRCGAGRDEAAQTAAQKTGGGKQASVCAPGGPAEPMIPRPFRPTWASVAIASVLGAAATVLVVWAALNGGVPDEQARLNPASVIGALPEPPPTLPGGSSLPGSAALPLGLPEGIGGLFQATPSDSVIPIIGMHNASEYMVYVVFLGPANTTKSIPAWGSVEFQLPQGMYQVEVWAVGTEKRAGTALFRRLTRYDCTWEVVTEPYFDEAPPLRLGDPH